VTTALRRITLVTSPDECNLACDMCRERSPHAPQRAGPPRRLDPALAVAAVDGAGPALREVIPSTAGEPLLWSGMDALLERCAARGALLNVTTNGTFPRLGAATWAERLAPAASDVKISWNGATAPTAERVMRGLSFDEATAAVREFLAVRDRERRAGRRACRVSFQVTAREANAAELPAIVRLAASLGVERVKVNQLQVHFAALAGEDLRRDGAARARWNAALRGMRAAAEEARLPTGARVALEGAGELDEGGADAPRGPCPFLGREAWVLWDGRIAPCPAPAAWAGALGDLGNAADAPLGSLFATASYRQLAGGYEALEACRRCAFRRPGGG
jgi:MoaA/NifB/PqqE/SkfB family radical SAM enzyme